MPFAPFSDRLLVEDLIRHVLPPGWQQDVDFDSLHKEETSHLATLPDGLPLRREGDRLWSTRLKPGGQLFFLFLEFQSSPDRWMALRLGLYTLMVWQILVKSDRIPPGGRLPPVVPVVLYNGEDAWNSSCSLDSLIDLPTGHTLWRWQPRFEYIMIDENIYGRGSRDPGESLVASLFGFDTATTPAQAREHLHRVIEHIQDTSPGVSETVWLFLKACGATERLGLRSDVKLAQEGVTMFVQRVDKWEADIRAEAGAEGEARGEARGKAEGKAEGKVEGQRQTIQLLLSHRFGEGSIAEVLPLLENVSDTSTLDQLALAAIRASDVDTFTHDLRSLLGRTDKHVHTS